MPIAPYLRGQAFDPETIKVMSAALEQVCVDLGISDLRKNPAAEIVAQSIIQHAQLGVRTQTALYLATITEFKVGDGSRVSGL